MFMIIKKKQIITLIGILVVMSLMSYGTDGIFSLILSIPAVLLAITVHEFGHAFAAYKLGDDTPVQQGRLTLNPLAHIDPTGMVCLIFAGFGWGKPVRVNRNSFVNKSPAFCETMVALAGPLMNFILAIVFKLAALLLLKFYYSIKLNFVTQT